MFVCFHISFGLHIVAANPVSSTLQNESCRTFEWVMSHVLLSHATVTHINEACHTYEWATAHIYKSLQHIATCFGRYHRRFELNCMRIEAGGFKLIYGWRLLPAGWVCTGKEDWGWDQDTFGVMKAIIIWWGAAVASSHLHFAIILYTL